MLVQDIMRTEVATVSAFATLREAMHLMKKHQVKSLVVDKANEHDAYGIITYTTILRTIVAEDGDIDLINVYDVASKPVLSVSRQLDVKHVARMMVSQDIRRIIVLNNNELEGIVTMNDIIKPVLDMAEQ